MSFVFFLGGADLEMATIRDLVTAKAGTAAIHDRGLAWGARLSDYAEDLAVLPADARPVLVELAIDLPLPNGAIVIDHHGEKSGRSARTSLEQVFRLLGCPMSEWTRRMSLVAANDRGHIAALRAMGADDREIQDIRAADRRIQGITARDEEDGRKALASRKQLLDGRLTVVDLPHEKVAVVTDPLALIPSPPRNLLIFSPSEVNFFGEGLAIDALDAVFPGGWKGGDLPEIGFWGHAEPLPDKTALMASLRNALA